MNVMEKEKCTAGFDPFNSSSLALGSFTHKPKQYCMFAAGNASCQATEKKEARRSLFWGMKTPDNESKANCKLSKAIAGLKINLPKIDKWIGNEASTKDVMTIPTIT